MAPRQLPTAFWLFVAATGAGWLLPAATGHADFDASPVSYAVNLAILGLEVFLTVLLARGSALAWGLLLFWVLLTTIATLPVGVVTDSAFWYLLLSICVLQTGLLVTPSVRNLHRSDEVGSGRQASSTG